jgi:hypothetical protein
MRFSAGNHAPCAAGCKRELWAALEWAMTFATESHTMMHFWCADGCAASDVLPRGRTVEDKDFDAKDAVDEILCWKSCPMRC